jgi:hypothetical protein
MYDLFFDINKRDLVIENGDFSMTSNPSVQNGAILKEARAFSASNPVWGIGLMEAINAPVSKMAYEMNRWADQAKKDGATIARYTLANDGKETTIDIEVSYL